jgi:8-oxo-dGTP pyrophosphatase MutT (NUDIX family)
MKIYLNDRIVHLRKEKPAGNDFHQVDNLKELSILYKAFEADPTHKRLVLYSPDYLRLKNDFFTLFNRVTAAGGLVRNETGGILFIFRRGHWDLPKGKLNRKLDGLEDCAEAAVREVKEETGLTNVEVVGRMTKTYHIFFEKRERWLKKTWWYEMRAPKDQQLIPQREEDITEVRWIAPTELDEVHKLLYPSLEKLLKKI